ncbi:GPW/gp25 family protein [Elioraea rosea]|uniref:GPW/gp25 family protein n=1 Tax=Elioraea rosea TaxID=2492390 RepID=UPI001183D27C|nr:GPW/gp25 family protein [Elioraea rosea]
MAARAFLSFPFQADARGRAATVGSERHVREMIEQVLFTAPGERPMRPEFGCGLRELLFQPASDALAAATQQMVQGALMRWLEDWVAVQRVTVTVEDAALIVTVVYAPRGTGEMRAETFTVPAGGP